MFLNALKIIIGILLIYIFYLTISSNSVSGSSFNFLGNLKIWLYDVFLIIKNGFTGIKLTG
jgi:hypothetical protein